MKQRILKVHPADNVLVALTDLQAGEEVQYDGGTYKLIDLIPAKHKFVVYDIPTGGDIIMYGVLVGRAQSAIPAGGLLSTANVKHAASGFLTTDRHTQWQQPDVS